MTTPPDFDGSEVSYANIVSALETKPSKGAALTDDFKTVRKALDALESWSGSEGEEFDVDAERAALDRLESRLREAENALRQVEANRDSLLLRVEETEDLLREAEAKVISAGYLDKNEMAERMEDAEDLLREEREQWHRQDESFRSQIRGLTADRDQLRKEKERLRQSEQAWLNECDRLRTELGGATKECDETHGLLYVEIARLRADLENCHADYMQADAERDRLRAAGRAVVESTTQWDEDEAIMRLGRELEKQREDWDNEWP